MKGATMVEEVLRADETSATLRLQCGHTVESDDPGTAVGRFALCPACASGLPIPAYPAPASRIECASGAQLDAITAVYADEMRKRGFTIGPNEIAAIRRSAAIQDVWRAAFARILGAA